MSFPAVESQARPQPPAEAAPRLAAALDVLGRGAVFSYNDTRSLLLNLNIVQLKAQTGSLQQELQQLLPQLSTGQAEMLREMGLESMSMNQFEQLLTEARPILNASVDAVKLEPAELRVSFDGNRPATVSSGPTSATDQQALLQLRSQAAASLRTEGSSLGDLGQDLEQSRSLDSFFETLDTDVGALLNSIRAGQTLQAVDKNQTGSIHGFDVNERLNYAVLKLIEAGPADAPILSQLEAYAQQAADGALPAPTQDQAAVLKSLGLAFEGN
ncbi:MAG: hypothetical protein CVV27_15265, partial [Candidatus Melainabacteria bacterium HGW-Melainabacteria-1]